MKLIRFNLLALFFAALALPLAAQTNTFPSSGNVGIGTTSPGSSLDIQIQANTLGLRIQNDAATTARLLAVSAGNAAWSNGNGVAQFMVGSPSSTGRAVTIINNGIGDSLYIDHLGASGNSLIVTGGKVGIGTTAPDQKLQVAGNVSFGGTTPHVDPYGSWSTQANPYLELRGDPNAQFGIPTVLFRVGGRTTNRDYNGGFSWVSSDYTSDDKRSASMNVLLSGANYDASVLRFLTRAAGASAPVEQMRISDSGNVGIGTTNPTQKLSVNGTIRAKEVVVDTGWSDYVFDESYELRTLSETEAYIKTEHHLPGIPSAQEVAEHGVTLGDMQSKLLAKVEELTLHLIRIEKENAALRARVQSLEAR